ncbi:MAG: CPBP family glutamic-type intramembrane protease [Promethearchaeota archaeon]
MLLKNQTFLEKIKVLLVPVAIIMGTCILIFVTRLKSYWLGFNAVWIDFSSYSYMQWIVLSAIIAGFFLLNEIITHFFIVNEKIDISKATFIKNKRDKNWGAVFGYYPLALLFEEILFRGILGGLEYEYLNAPGWLIVLLNGLIFGLYHIHIYFSTHNIRLTLLYVVLSFGLGLLLCWQLPYWGVLGCWILHLVIVTLFYMRWNHFIPNFL